MKKVLFVCLGNICRSPLAEAIFNEKIKQKGLSNQFKADSAGTANYHVGEQPDQRSIDISLSHDVPIDHKGQQFKKRLASQFDYLVAMDNSNLQNMISEIGSKPSFLFLMRDFDPDGKGLDVPDPYYGGLNGFENVYQILDRSIEELIVYLNE
ncbi:MAG: low molecular weight protein-tyrosine-phosphatase [Ekhidna sp.]